MPDTIQKTIGDPLAKVLNSFIDQAPNVLFAVLMIILGFVLGDILGRAITHFLHLLKVDRVLDHAGMEDLSKRVGFGVSVSKFIGQLVKWSLVITFAMIATDNLGLKAFTAYLYKILNYLPSVFSAGLIFVATFAAAEFVSRLVDGSVRAAGLKVRSAGHICKYAIMVFGVLSALSELKIASGFMEILFQGIVYSSALALGLAFGLGGRDAAAKLIEKVSNN